MTKLLAAICLCAGLSRAFAAEPVVPSPPQERPARVGDEGVFRLAQGGTVAGALLRRDPAGDVLRLRSGEEATLAPGAVVAWVGPFEPATPPERTWGAAPTVLRHLHVPTASGPDRGSLVLGLTGFDAAATYGVAGWLSASLACASPVVLGSPLPVPAAVPGVDVHVALQPWLRARAGVRGYLSKAGTQVVALGAITVGDDDGHVTLYAGPPVPAAARLGSFDRTVLGLAATLRTGGSLALVGEVWASPRTSLTAGGAAALRWIRGGLTLDAGAIGAPGRVAPWLAVSWTLSPGGTP